MNSAVFNNEENALRLQRVVKQDSETPWVLAMAPVQLAPHVYYVGSSWVGVTVIDTGDGLIMIDTGMPFQLYTIFEGMRALGLDPKQVKLLLISHGHYDHVGAAKAILEHTGAKLYCAQEDLEAVAGRDLDALRNHNKPYTGVTPDGFFSDDEPIALGNITIHTKLTAGHTPGTTSFFFQDKDDSGRVFNLGLHGGMGLNTMQNNEEAPAKRKIYRENMNLLRTFPIDITCSNHPAMAHLYERAEQNKGAEYPFYDPTVWPNMIDHFLALLDSLEAQG